MASLDLIRFICPACGHSTEVPVISAGSTINCPSCKTSQRVSAPAPQTPPPVVPLAAASPAISLTPSGGSPIIDDNKKLFVCACCSYRARIPIQYLGMAVRCPSCDAPQIASGEEQAARTGRTVSINRMQSAATASKAANIRPGNLLFTCAQCNFEAQLAQHYLGKAIRCPGCHSAQVVADGITAKLPNAAAVAASAAASTAPLAPPAVPVTPMVPPAAAGPASENLAAVSERATTHDGQPLFVCSACGYRARIPEQYLGMAVTCPSCEVVQIANAQPTDQPSTGNTQRLAKIKTADPVEPTATADNEKIPFTCTACGFNTHLGASLAGKAIRCPSCQATQVVPGKIIGAATFDKPSPIPAAMSAGAPPSADKVRFTCTSCGFKARIPAHYAGQVIHCPGCNSVQLVVASSPGSATGNTRVLSKVQTADAKPASKPVSAEDLPSVSSALEASSTVSPPAAGPASSPALDDGFSALTPAMPHPVLSPPVAKPATSQIRRATPPSAAKPATATLAKPTTDRNAKVEAKAEAEDSSSASASKNATTSAVRPSTAPVTAPESGALMRATADLPPSTLEDDLIKPPTDLFSTVGSKKPVKSNPTSATAGKVVRRSGNTQRHPSSAALPPPSDSPKPMPDSVQADAASANNNTPEKIRTSEPATRIDTEENDHMATRSNNGPILIILAVIVLVMIGGGVFGGLQLSKINDQLTQANLKLSKAELDTEKARNEAKEEQRKREESEKALKKAQDELKEAQEKAAQERAEREKAERERAEKEKAERERAEREKAEREKAEKEKAAAVKSNPTTSETTK